MKTLFILLLLCCATLSHAQLKISSVSGNSESFQKLIQSLMGDGIIITNISTNQSDSSLALGVFEDPGKTFGMDKGIIATTGSISRVAQKNSFEGMTAYDGGDIIEDGWHNHSLTGTRIPELEDLLGGTRTNDGIIIELDIIPMADTLSFSYVFGSEEYDEYVCSEFNDIFAFFISGEGIEGIKNMAVLPGTDTPVSINNVNNGNPDNPSCVSSNSTYYQKNEGAIIEYDGFTRLLEIKQKVIPGKTYHLKLCIADASDNALDSGILIEHTSVVSFHEDLSVYFNTNSAELTDEYKNELNRVVDLMKQNNVRSLVVSGHTDGDGSDKFNFRLSEKRAENVVNYLISLGLESDQITVKVRGEAMPYSDNSTEVGKAANRRVDVRLLGNSEKFEPTIEENEYADIATLNQNYPNPFSNQTVLEYYIPSKSRRAELVIMSLDGKIIDRIVILQHGHGKVAIDGSKYATGTYMANLFVDDLLTESVKMIKN
ncbi:MAG: choice-of-anchor L domain-containing protein [Flavobacteriales bacterium]|nr:choice-of-anchor L domain-containing protein [Flavobacteriales bacterium]